MDFRPPAETPDTAYPFWLITGTIFTQFLTGTMSRRCPSLHHENPEVFIQIQPKDAQRLNLKEGENLKVSSRRAAQR
jgi:anaerobic selenocysteine-containing dehydrogenase